MRVLLIEDSLKLSEAVAKGLKRSGFAVDVAMDGRTGLWQAMSHDFDVIILDIMLPGMDGLDVLRSLREAKRRAHVLLLTARDTVADRVRGLRGGADDYLVKPFAFDELLARVEALIRRHHATTDPVLCIGNLRIDTTQRTVQRHNTPLELTARQYALLEYMALNANTLLSRTQIEAHLYDEQSEPMSNVVDATIYALRKRIDRPGQPSLIQTRRGMGYILQLDPSAEGDDRDGNS